MCFIEWISVYLISVYVVNVDMMCLNEWMSVYLANVDMLWGGGGRYWVGLQNAASS